MRNTFLSGAHLPGPASPVVAGTGRAGKRSPPPRNACSNRRWFSGLDFHSFSRRTLGIGLAKAFLESGGGPGTEELADCLTEITSL
jgi:hypothetical protein